MDGWLATAALMTAEDQLTEKGFSNVACFSTSEYS